MDFKLRKRRDQAGGTHGSVMLSIMVPMSIIAKEGAPVEVGMVTILFT